MNFTFALHSHPSTVDPIEVTAAESALLLKAAVSGDASLYSTGARTDAARARMLRRMGGDGLVVFIDAAAGGWEKGMWGAHLTCLGWNALYRHYHDRHRGPRNCPGTWQPDGTCSGCAQHRPLDKAAHEAYCATLSDQDFAEQVNGPQLWCIEHGFMRRRDITTKKVCMLAGSSQHDGGLDRLGPTR